MPEALDRATQHVVPEDLSGMVLDREELPDELQGFEIGREGVLDNETMAAQGFPGSTTGETRATGRITGYLREFYDPVEPGPEDTGANIIGATVVHLFENEEAVWGWMKEKFLGEFQRFVGKELENQQQLVSADELQFDGLLRSCRGTPDPANIPIWSGIMHHSRLPGRLSTGSNVPGGCGRCPAGTSGR